MVRTRTASPPSPEDSDRKTIDNRKTIDKLLQRLEKHKTSRKNRRQRRVFRSHPTAPRAKINYFTVMNIPVALLFLGCCAVIGYVYTLTAGVYVEAFAEYGSAQQVINISLGSEAVSKFPFLGFLLALPLRFGEWVVNGFETNSYGLLGGCIFVILQSLELLPTVIWESPGLILALISRLDKRMNKIAYQKTDSEFIRRLKERHNSYYDQLIQGLDDMKMIAFAADIALCFLVIKFVAIDRTDAGEPILGTFMEGTQLYNFGWHSLDPLATFKVLSSLFLLLILTKLGMKIFYGFRAFAKREETDA